MPTDAYMAIEFAQSKGQARQEGKTGVKFNDVAGMDQTLVELQEIVEVKFLPKLPVSFKAWHSASSCISRLELHQALICQSNA